MHAFLASPVFAVEGHRGRGLGVWLVETVLGHLDLRGLRRALATRDANTLSERFGFRPVDPRVHRALDRPPHDLYMEQAGGTESPPRGVHSHGEEESGR